MLSVITSYYDRPDALEKYNNFIATIKNPKIEFIIEKWEEPEMFSTAICHNRACIKSTGEWILKMDIDCYTDGKMLEKILTLIENKDKYFFTNFGCKDYLGDLGFPQGNQYLCSKYLYLCVDGEPDFYGYGFEDYCILYKMAKINLFNCEYNTPDELYIIIRDLIARKLNKEYQEYYFFHNDHERQNYEMRKMADENKIKMFEICREFDKCLKQI